MVIFRILLVIVALSAKASSDSILVFVKVIKFKLDGLIVFLKPRVLLLLGEVEFFECFQESLS